MYSVLHAALLSVACLALFVACCKVIADMPQPVKEARASLAHCSAEPLCFNVRQRCNAAAL
jgi:hypothetical protein